MSLLTTPYVPTASMEKAVVRANADRVRRWRVWLVSTTALQTKHILNRQIALRNGAKVGYFFKQVRGALAGMDPARILAG